MPLHEKAVYQDENNKWVTVTYEELISSSAQFRAELRNNTLYDSEHCKKELGIRDRKGSLHYYQKKNFRSILDGKSKDSSAHDGEIKALTSFLNNNEKIIIGNYIFDNGEKLFQTIIKVKNFSWQKEVNFPVSQSGYMRCDILGRSNDLCWSEKSPYIAIEVVDTHFSSKETFVALMELSKTLPLIVGYYFLKENGKFNHKEKNTRSNGYAKIRLSCYILDGGFWILDDQLNDHLDNPDDFNVLYEYVYNKIKNKYKN